jgi:glycosyltransferase involved in cell wall biosynthesis
MGGKIDISIIIPTILRKDRIKKIEQALDALTDQSFSQGMNFEVIIVDNGNSLSNQKISQKYKNKIKNLIIIKEPVIGLSKARNTGILNSKGKIIAFIDDDVRPSENWASALIKAHGTPGAFCVGGPVIISNPALPSWLSDYFLRFLAPPKFPKKFGVISEPFYLIGANVSFKQRVFKQHGLFDERLGRKGKNLLSGEDIEFINRLESKNVYFEPKARVTTKISPNRLTRRYFVKRIFWQAISEARIVNKLGTDWLYDKKELSFSKDFFGSLLRSLKEYNFLQFFCMVIRIITFKICLTFNL